MGGKIEYRISLASIGMTTIFFGAIFILIFLYNLLQMKLSNPIELLRGGNTGEREPKTKWIMTIIGILCLAGGYSIALITKEPMPALGKFFIAVILVIIGTYALFMAGSIAFLKMLRNKKSYYYKTRHFTAVSGMIYRMKQNAVGLANICILSTMVLVMVSMIKKNFIFFQFYILPFCLIVIRKWNQSKRRRTDRRNYKEYDKEKSHSANFTDTFSCRAIYNSI